MPRRPFILGAILAGIAVAGLAPPAHADYAIQVYDDGKLQSTVAVVAVGNTLVFAGTTTDFSITNGSGLSNNPGSQGSSYLSLSSNEQISTNFGDAGGTHTIQIVLTQNGWTAPTGTPLNLSSSAGGTFTYASGNTPGAVDSVTATYQGFLDNTNTPFGQPADGSTAIETAGAMLNATNTVPLVFNPPSSTTLVPGGVPFSITDVLTFTFTLGAGSGQVTANVSASTVASVPAPAGLILAITGFPALGIGAWLRRGRSRV